MPPQIKTHEKANPVFLRFNELMQDHAPELLVGPKRRRRFSDNTARNPFVMTFGSNYEIFGNEKCDVEGNCGVANGLALRKPPNSILTAFEALYSLYRALLISKQIDCSSIIMPSDIVRADQEELAQLRRQFYYCNSLSELAARMWSMCYQFRPNHHASSEDWNYVSLSLRSGALFFVFESDYLSAAAQTLQDIVNGLIKLPSNTSIKLNYRGRTIALTFNNESGFIPLGMVDKDGKLIPKCQLICAEFLHELDKKLGVTHLLAAFEGKDYYCANQGIKIAYSLFGLNMKILAAGVRDGADGQTIIFDNAVYPESA